ncbi:ORF038 [Saltwater crocodilepox virus]|nr:ORF038 [Saltwater crocodilepox virus]QGT47767.1 ORF038 [Saltwater crocodilepox virus]QGT47978.1 ORF038 [Saltwater crocodilepox virus]QGT48191.1 ORF038 [Saltwater crocodilepox virus]QGT48407.1 ORF038 [Saltwater crocodilepox virus]
MDESDPYRVLGVDYRVTKEGLKTVYKSLCLKFHPDKNPDGEETFKKVQKAYAAIINGYSFALNLTLNEVYTGCVVRFNVGNKSYRLSLLPGVRDDCPIIKMVGERVCVFRVRVVRDMIYSRRDYDILGTFNVSFRNAVCGFSKVINLPGNRIFTLAVRPFQLFSEPRLVLSSQGFCYGGKSGDAIISFNVVIDPNYTRPENVEILARTLDFVSKKALPRLSEVKRHFRTVKEAGAAAPV